MSNFFETFAFPKKAKTEAGAEAETILEIKKEETTPNSLIKYGELIINNFCKNYENYKHINTFLKI